MTNPRFVPVTLDDRMWFFNCAKDAVNLLDPRAVVWLNRNIHEKDANNLSGRIHAGYKIHKGVTPTGANMMQLAGAAGADIIIVSGFQGTVLEDFFAFWDELSLLQAPTLEHLWAFQAGTYSVEIWQETFSVRQPLLDATIDNWDDFEDTLQTVSRNVSIDFFFFEAEKKCYVHFDMSLDRNLRQSFLSLVADDPQAYADWLRSDGRISRDLWYVPSTANHALPLVTSAQVSDIAIDVNALDPTQISDDVAPCPGNCFLLNVCSITSTGIQQYDPAGGNLAIQLEVVLAKPYCVDPNDHTQPCM